jgi:hypothetical protein
MGASLTTWSTPSILAMSDFSWILRSIPVESLASNLVSSSWAIMLAKRIDDWRGRHPENFLEHFAVVDSILERRGNTR